MTTDELRIILSVNGAQGYVNAMNRVTRETRGFDTAAGKLTSTLVKLVSAAAIIKFGKQCITAASDLQKAANAMNVTFGGGAALVDKWAKTSASSFGLSETAAKSYIGMYGTMAVQFGYTREQAAQMGIELTKLTGDVASFYNIEDKLAAVKLKSIFTGETETLKQLGVVMTQANLDAYAMEKGLGKTTKQMSENEKVALRYNFVMDKLSHAQGDFARTSDGWANSVKLLKLNLENLKIEIGNQLLPVAGQGLAAINKGLQTLSPILVSVATTIKLYAQAWKNASETTKGVVKTAMAAFAVAIAAPRVITIVSKAIKVLTVDALTLGGALSFVAGLAGIILAGIALADLAKQVKELRSTTENISNIGESAENISNIGESADVSADAVDDLSEAMSGLGDATEGLDTFLASFDEVNKVGGNNSLMSNLVNTEDLANILGVADGLGDIQSSVDQLNSSLGNMEFPDLSKGTILDPEWWKKKWQGVRKFFSTFFNGEWKENWNIGFDMIGQWFEEHFPKWTAFWELVGECMANTFEPVKKVLREISDLFDTIAQEFENSAWFKYFAGAGEKAYDLQHENDAEKDDTFTYTSKSGVKREALKYYPDGSETELYKKHKAMYNEDGSETGLYKRLQTPDLPKAKNSETELYKKYQALQREVLKYNADGTESELYKKYQAPRGVKREALKYYPDGSETGLYKRLQTPELPKAKNDNSAYRSYKSKLVDDAESDLKKRIQNYTINQPNIPNIAQTTYNSYQQPNSSTTINNNYNNYTVAPQPEKEKETVVEFNPTIQLDGRIISAIVINDINKRTRSSGKSPLIELGG